MTCGKCKHAYDSDDDGIVCRRNPPQGLMSVTPSKLAGAPPTITKISFYPPVNKDMGCGEYQAAD
jgi:hypothetical protein